MEKEWNAQKEWKTITYEYVLTYHHSDIATIPGKPSATKKYHKLNKIFFQRVSINCT